MVQAVFERWSGFLEDVEGRHAELMAEALQQCGEAHQAAGLDPASLDERWNAVAVEAQQLRQGIDEAFAGPIGAAFADASATDEYVIEQRAQGAAFARRLERFRERTRVTIYADAARRIIQAALEEQVHGHPCTECGEPIHVPDGTFVALDVFCAMCGKPQRYEPGGWVQLAGAWCVHPLAEERAFDAWARLQDAEHARVTAPHDTLQAIEQHERAYKAYARSYFLGRAMVVPGYRGTVDPDVRAWMDSFYQGLEASEVWGQAGRPRIP